MGPQPAFAARASPSALLPTSLLSPASPRPPHTASETPRATPALVQHHAQLPQQTASSLEPGSTPSADHTALISTSPRPSSSPRGDDRRVPPVANGLEQSLRRAVELARREQDEGGPPSRRGFPKGLEGLERRPRTRERRHAVAVGAGADVALDRRQWQIPQAEGYPSCYYVDLSVFTCYPESNTTLIQDDYSLAIWNSAQPSFISRGRVDVYLYNADTQDVATSWRNESNAQGMIGIVPDDPWWPSGQTAQQWFGASARNRSTPYFFVVVPAGDTLTGGEVHGATFTAIQTAAPTSLASALAALTTSSLSSLSSASLASISSISSLSAASASSASASGDSWSGSSRSTSRSGPGSLQNESSSGGPSIPNYAIALIVVLGFLALLAGAIAVYCCLGRGRRRRRQDEAAAAAAAAAGAGRRGASSGDLTDLGSAEPMLGGAAGAGAAASAGTRESRASSRAAPPAGLLGTGMVGGAAVGGAAAAAATAGGGKDPEKDDDNTLSQSDAARMAEAFRAALRKPEYAPAVPAVAPPLASSVGSGTSAGPGGGPSPTGAPEGTDSSGSGGSGEGNGVGRGIMEEELRSEGKSMRSVEGGGRRWGRTG